MHRTMRFFCRNDGNRTGGIGRWKRMRVLGTTVIGYKTWTSGAFDPAQFGGGPTAGGAGYFEKYITDLTPGTNITVTVGTGGLAYTTGNGSNGICIVEW